MASLYLISNSNNYKDVVNENDWGVGDYYDGKKKENNDLEEENNNKSDKDYAPAIFLDILRITPLVTIRQAFLDIFRKTILNKLEEAAIILNANKIFRLIAMFGFIANYNYN